MRFNKNILILTAIIFLVVMAKYSWSESGSNKKLAVQYRIVKTTDISVGMNIRKEYRIVVPSMISKEDLKNSMKNVVEQETRRNPDIDEIVIFAYDRVEDSGGVYTFGKMEWCPNGKWGGMTPQIASSNNRSSYKFNFYISDKVGNISADDIPTEREYEIFYTYDKALWADPDLDEDIIKKRIAKKLGISEEELYEIYIKVSVHQIK